MLKLTRFQLEADYRVEAEIEVLNTLAKRSLTDKALITTLNSLRNKVGEELIQETLVRLTKQGLIVRSQNYPFEYRLSELYKVYQNHKNYKVFKA